MSPPVATPSAATTVSASTSYLSSQSSFGTMDSGMSLICESNIMDHHHHHHHPHHHTHLHHHHNHNSLSCMQSGVTGGSVTSLGDLIKHEPALAMMNLSTDYGISCSNSNSGSSGSGSSSLFLSTSPNSAFLVSNGAGIVDFHNNNNNNEFFEAFSFDKFNMGNSLCDLYPSVGDIFSSYHPTSASGGGSSNSNIGHVSHENGTDNGCGDESELGALIGGNTIYSPFNDEDADDDYHNNNEHNEHNDVDGDDEIESDECQRPDDNIDESQCRRLATTQLSRKYTLSTSSSSLASNNIKKVAIELQHTVGINSSQNTGDISSNGDSLFSSSSSSSSASPVATSQAVGASSSSSADGQLGGAGGGVGLDLFDCSTLSDMHMKLDDTDFDDTDFEDLLALDDWEQMLDEDCISRLTADFNTANPSNNTNTNTSTATTSTSKSGLQVTGSSAITLATTTSTAAKSLQQHYQQQQQQQQQHVMQQPSAKSSSLVIKTTTSATSNNTNNNNNNNSNALSSFGHNGSSQKSVTLRLPQSVAAALPRVHQLNACSTSSSITSTSANKPHQQQPIVVLVSSPSQSGVCLFLLLLQITFTEICSLFIYLFVCLCVQVVVTAFADKVSHDHADHHADSEEERRVASVDHLLDQVE